MDINLYLLILVFLASLGVFSIFRLCPGIKNFSPNKRNLISMFLTVLLGLILSVCLQMQIGNFLGFWGVFPILFGVVFTMGFSAFLIYPFGKFLSSKESTPEKRRETSVWILPLLGMVLFILHLDIHTEAICGPYPWIKFIAVFVLSIIAIKIIYKSSWSRTIGAAVLFSVLLMFIAGLYFCFDCCPASGALNTGWSKLQPISASITYKSNGSFEASFQNTVGTSIKVSGVSAKEIIQQGVCSGVLVGGKVPSSDGLVSVKAGDGFEVTMVCPAKAEGDPYDLELSINYSVVIGGVTQEYSDQGHIRGPVEP